MLSIATMARIIISILLLLIGFQSHSQIAMFHAHNQMPSGTPLILDSFPGAVVAFALHKLDKDYTGYAIKVRRQGQLGTQDIGFNSSGGLDTAALLSYASVNAVFITTIYDQSGNGRDATQSDTSLQPRIKATGSNSIDKINGVPAFLNSSATQAAYLTFTRLDLTAATMFSVLRNTSGTYNVPLTIQKSSSALNQFVTLIGTDNNYGPLMVVAEANGTSGGRGGNTNVNTNRVFTALWDGLGTNGASFYKIWDNSSSITLSNSAVNGATTTAWTSAIGANVENSGYTLRFNGNIGPIIVYGSDKTSDRTTIENNLNRHFNYIY